MNKADISRRAKELLIEGLRLEMTPEEIVDSEPIFGEGLGLDSIDALTDFIHASRQAQAG